MCQLAPWNPRPRNGRMTLSFPLGGAPPRNGKGKTQEWTGSGILWPPTAPLLPKPIKSIRFYFYFFKFSLILGRILTQHLQRARRIAEKCSFSSVLVRPSGPERPIRAPHRRRAGSKWETLAGVGAVGGTGARPTNHLERSGAAAHTRTNISSALVALGHARAVISSAVVAPRHARAATASALAAMGQA